MKTDDIKVNESTKSNFGPWGWFIIVFTFFTLMFAGNLIIDGLNITLEAFHGLHGWDVGKLLSYSTLAGLIAIPGSGILGRLIEKIGARKVFCITLISVAICCFFWGHVQEVWQYVVILILVNVLGNGFGFIASTAIIANWFPRKKGLAMGWNTIGFQASAVALLPLVAAIIRNLGLAAAYNFIGISLVILTIICIVFVRDHPEERGCAPDNDKSRSIEEYRRLHEEAKEYMKTSPFTIKRLLKTKQLWQVGIVLGLMQMSVSGLISQFVPKMVSVGLDQDKALIVYSVASIIGGVFSYLWGVLDQKLGTKKTTALACLSHALAAFACAISGSLITGMPWLFFSAVLVAINLGVSSNLLGSFIVTIFGRYDFSRSYTVSYMITCGIRSLSFFTVGTLYSLTGGYTMPYIATGLVAIIGMVITYFINDGLIGRAE